MDYASPIVQRIARIPGMVYVVVALLCAYGLTGSNPGLTACAGLLLLWMFMLLWRPGEPPILLLALGFQWLQVVIKVLEANILNRPVRTLDQLGGDIEAAIMLSIIALAVLTLGIAMTVPAYNRQRIDVAQMQALSLSPRRLWYLYIVGAIGSAMVLFAGRSIPGLAQIALAASNIKWAIFFMLAYVCFLRRSFLYLLMMAFVIELLLGVGSYFSDFKTVFFVTMLAYIMVGRHFSLRQYLTLGVMTGVLIWMSLLWTAVKVDYRSYLSNSVQAQIVTRDYGERINRLFDMVSSLDDDDMDRGMRDLVSRISYVDFFGAVLENVPSRIRHEDGELWKGALRHVFMPRLLFPDKPVLRDDTEITQYYTGLITPGSTTATSISMGYVADSYIDFGVPVMYLPIYLLGLLWGLLYRYFVRSADGSYLVGYALSVVVLLNAMSFEIGIVKLLGSVLTSFLVAWATMKFIRATGFMTLLHRSQNSLQTVFPTGKLSRT